jgi:hypothetical protein
MSFEVKIGRRALRVPREVEAAGGKSVDRWIAEQTASKASRKKKARRKGSRSTRPAAAPQATHSEETD